MRASIAILLGLAATACDQGIQVLNVAPAVTAVGPVSLEDAGGAPRLSIIFWVRDHEEDAVDVTFEVVQPGVAPRAIEVVDGHGDIGLTTTNEATGMPHVVFWPLGDVAPNAPIRLRITPIDDHGDVGPTFETPEFSPGAGLPPPPSA